MAGGPLIEEEHPAARRTVAPEQSAVSAMIAATVLFLLLAWALGASATSIQLAANKEVEFFDVLQKGDKWGAQFQLVDGSVGFRVRHTLGAAVATGERC